MNPAALPPVQFRGPIYCDTAHMWMGIHEPVNTITNAAILIAAWYAYRYIKKSRVGFSGDLILLLLLLTAVGIGSTLWHGLRTMWALQLDWIPGVLYLFVLTVVWIRQAFARAWVGWIAGVAGLILMIAVSIVGIGVFGNMLARITPNLRFAPMFATVTLFGVGMVTATGRKYGREAAIEGVLILLAGIVAAIARSIDLMVCQVIPFGTHFLWHIGLSTAACLGILLMVRIKKSRIANSE